MGKYIRRRSPKSGGEVVAPVYTGMRTRARTRALQRAGSADDGCYLQLRSRRLEKLPIVVKKKQRGGGVKRGNARDPKPDCELEKKGAGDGAGEASTEENSVDSESLERSTRETTPCDLIRDPTIIVAPFSSPRPVRIVEVQKRADIPMLRPISPTHEMEMEMDAYFAAAEAKQQQEFIEKYNFDPVNEVPLPGRYDWVKVNPKA